MQANIENYRPIIGIQSMHGFKISNGINITCFTNYKCNMIGLIYFCGNTGYYEFQRLYLQNHTLQGSYKYDSYRSVV